MLGASERGAMLGASEWGAMLGASEWAHVVRHLTREQVQALEGGAGPGLRGVLREARRLRERADVLGAPLVLTPAPGVEVTCAPVAGGREYALAWPGGERTVPRRTLVHEAPDACVPFWTRDARLLESRLDGVPGSRLCTLVARDDARDVARWRRLVQQHVRRYVVLRTATDPPRPRRGRRARRWTKVAWPPPLRGPGHPPEPPHGPPATPA